MLVNNFKNVLRNDMNFYLMNLDYAIFLNLKRQYYIFNTVFLKKKL